MLKACLLYTSPEDEDEYEEDCDDEEAKYYFDEWGLVDFMKSLGYEYHE